MPRYQQLEQNQLDDAQRQTQEGDRLGGMRFAFPPYEVTCAPLTVTPGDKL
jgi:hypothetical protein